MEQATLRFFELSEHRKHLLLWTNVFNLYNNLVGSELVAFCYKLAPKLHEIILYSWNIYVGFGGREGRLFFVWGFVVVV